MKKALLALALLLVISGKGQKDGLSSPLHFNAFGFHLGMVTMPTTPLNQAFLAQLAPNDTTLKKDFSTFNESLFLSSNAFHFNAYAVFVSKKTDGKRNEKIEFRIGLIYQNTPSRGIEFIRRDSIRQDTFYSSTTGMTVYDDSVITHEYSITYHGQKAGLDLSNTFQFNKNSVVRFYAGYNLCLFYSFDNSVQSGYSDGEYRRGWHRKSYRYANLQKTELRDNFLLSGSLPIGCSVRLLAKRKNMVLRPAVNAELRIGLTEDKIGDKVLPVKPWFVFSAGLKFYRHKIIFYKD